MSGTLIDFDWKISTTLATDSMSQQYTPTMLLTLYYNDEEMHKREAYFEFSPNQLHEFIEKLHTVQDTVRKVVPQ
ncbi:putative COMM domain [Monocercomonoides exilis]|uniref:putative COMM domain n=1 Tax=Monocercomonoides exilis TaxID=2049356 RepID=UPI00355A8889|nr:putative COMM domain [Monocercomonoides exilis]|eukprot:MONOS_1009.1-p1 / transcript=MONOS_1009.1 / gene=MONOS_1009 / organism=Monocercomonoides_exilis_PA203 / gene_product=unspecified product / transcript_product=unspecified product / location=Mono_scaffold00017:20573-20950(+) / protein_length=74 / sequence_SO=supercontig / SO=protein_coding / is_pseudo=false